MYQLIAAIFTITVFVGPVVAGVINTWQHAIGGLF